MLVVDLILELAWASTGRASGGLNKIVGEGVRGPARRGRPGGRVGSSG